MSVKIRKTKGTEFLPYKFTEEELREKAAEMAQQTISAAALEEKKKSVVANFKAEIEACQLQAGICARHIRDGHEYRQIEVETVLNYDDGTVTIFRVDTGECVKARAMRDDERQQTLFEAAEDER